MIIYNTFLDFGVIGELDIEVHFTYHKAFRDKHRETPDEPEGVTIERILVQFNTINLDIIDMLTQDVIDNLSIDCLDYYKESRYQ